MTTVVPQWGPLFSTKPSSLERYMWGRGQNKPTADHPSLQPSTRTPLSKTLTGRGATRAGATRKSDQVSGARGKRKTHKPSTGAGIGPPPLTLRLSVPSGLSGGSVRMNCDLFLWKLSRVHRTVPPLSTPAPEQSPASLGIHPSSTYVQWGGWVTHRIRSSSLRTPGIHASLRV